MAACQSIRRFHFGWCGIARLTVEWRRVLSRLVGRSPSPVTISRAVERIRIRRRAWSSTKSPDARRQVVAHGGGGDARFAHRMADLIETDHHIARGVEAGHARALVGVRLNAPFVGQLGAEVRGQT